MAGKFAVLYTHQKTKKAKSWRDGKLEVSIDGKYAVLKNDESKRIDSLSLKMDVHVGDDLESVKYLIQVDDIAEFENMPTASIEKIEPSVIVGSVQGYLDIPGSVKRRKLGFKNPGVQSNEAKLQKKGVDDILSANSGLSFSILYTHQKWKKHKTWQDGTLFINNDGKSGLLKDENEKNIGEVCLRNLVAVGDELESAKYLIQIDSATCMVPINKHESFSVESSAVTDSASNKTNGEIAIQQTGQTKKKKFTAPRRTGPPVDSTFSSDIMNHNDEFAGMACTVVRQDADGIWESTDYNQGAAKAKTSQPLLADKLNSHNKAPTPTEDRNIRSRKDILNFLQQARQKYCEKGLAAETIGLEYDKENVANSSECGTRPDPNLSIDNASDSEIEELSLAHSPSLQSPDELKTTGEFSLSPDFSLT